MNVVSPIRDKAALARMKAEARKMGMEPYMLVLLGLNTGLRISDLLTLKVWDIRERGYIVRKEKKTGKHTEIVFDDNVLMELRQLIPREWKSTRYIFQSSHTRDGAHPITRNTAYHWINTACKRAGITEPVGCHTLRKTFGYHYYQKYKDIVSLMLFFNHSEERITLRYIGYTQAMLNEKMQGFRL